MHLAELATLIRLEQSITGAGDLHGYRHVKSAQASACLLPKHCDHGKTPDEGLWQGGRGIQVGA